MPQHRRRVPFSNKKKKDQILAKRQSRTSSLYLKSYDSNDEDETTEEAVGVQKLNSQPSSRVARNRNVNRYNLQFYEESKREIELMKQEANLPLREVERKDLEMTFKFFEGYNFPVRPPWNYDMSRDELNRNENKYLREYVDNLSKLHKDENKRLSLFELNLETWRQLWRVLEISDILLIIVDVRYSTLMFPPSLYTYITETLKKRAILILNKVDLVAPQTILAWKAYFKETYPDLPVIIFASNQTKKKRQGGNTAIIQKRSYEGVLQVFKECQKMVQSEIDLASWEAKILEDMGVDEEASGTVEEHQTHIQADDFNFEQHEAFKNGIVTIGCIGFPNVGKSSFINALKGRKVVSVSRTPGHTKHFQTIFLTNNVKLCDCPGLVFPSSTPKYLQVLLGSYPISQLKQPYPSLKFLGERLNLPKLLKISLPVDYDGWTATALCEAWACKKGFLTAKASRPDLYRAANHLLRMCLGGQLVLEFYPPGYVEKEEEFKNHLDLGDVIKFQGIIPGETVATGLEAAGGDEKGNSDDGEFSEDCSSDVSSDDEDSDNGGRYRGNNAFSVLDD